MKRVYASELGEGDTIVIPPSLVMSKAVIKSLTSIPTKQGPVIVLDVESNGKLWTPSKARFAFHSSERVECKPFRVPMRSRLWAALCAIGRFLNFTR
jgi:hypothetical protein